MCVNCGSNLTTNQWELTNYYSTSLLVLPLCSYGKALDFMIKNTRFIKKTLDLK